MLFLLLFESETLKRQMCKQALYVGEGGTKSLTFRDGSAQTASDPSVVWIQLIKTGSRSAPGPPPPSQDRPPPCRCPSPLSRDRHPYAGTAPPFVGTVTPMPGPPPLCRDHLPVPGPSPFAGTVPTMLGPPPPAPGPPPPPCVGTIPLCRDRPLSQS